LEEMSSGCVSFLMGSLQHDQLMTNRENLGLHCGLGSKTGEQGPEHHEYKVEHEYKAEHGWRRLTIVACNFNHHNAEELFRGHSG